MSEWRKFDYKNWDEKGWIFCNKCGLKNRGDSGWYTKERSYDPEYRALELNCMMLMPNMPEIQKREYKCNYCWKEENKKVRCCSVCKSPDHTKKTCKNE